MRVLTAILSRAFAVGIPSREAWWAGHRALAAEAETPLDLAILGGFAADRLGYAFASGYQAALRALVPDLPAGELASLCVTERGGGHPRAIEARLDPAGPDRFLLTGHKRWATLGGDAGLLLVVASLGDDERGHKRLRVARLPAERAGVSRRPMPAPPFVPEIAHDEIDLAAVTVSEDELLPGDGWARYVRPFRTVEDLHVHAAALAYALREARAHDRALVPRLAALIAALAPLAAADPEEPAAHVALAGVLELARAPLDDLAGALPDSPARARWERDRPLLGVAAGVRAARLAKAWEMLAR
jgi:alkylation response protein AidB-like acyl-CoA dehydrogenase